MATLHFKSGFLLLGQSVLLDLVQMTLYNKKGQQQKEHQHEYGDVLLFALVFLLFFVVVFVCHRLTCLVFCNFGLCGFAYVVEQFAPVANDFLLEFLNANVSAQCITVCD